MNIEIMEFYPLECDEARGLLTGTLRVKLPEIGIHILGIHVSKRKECWFFTMPGRTSTHHESGESIRYPFFVFEDRDKQKEFIAAIREQGRAFIEMRLADGGNSLVFPQKREFQTKQSKTQVRKDIAPEAKQSAFIAISKSASARSDPIASKIAAKNWVDLPKKRGVIDGR